MCAFHTSQLSDKSSEHFVPSVVYSNLIDLALFSSSFNLFSTSVSLNNWADNRVHLMHVNTGPEQPHAEHAHEAQSPRQSNIIEKLVLDQS